MLLFRDSFHIISQGENSHYLELLGSVEDDEKKKNYFLLTLVCIWQTEFVWNNFNVFYKVHVE